MDHDLAVWTELAAILECSRLFEHKLIIRSSVLKLLSSESDFATPTHELCIPVGVVVLLVVGGRLWVVVRVPALAAAILAWVNAARQFRLLECHVLLLRRTCAPAFLLLISRLVAFILALNEFVIIVSAVILDSLVEALCRCLLCVDYNL